MSNPSAAEELSLPFPLGGSIGEFHWSWKGKSVTLVYEVWGKGQPILLLPSLSTVSSRMEMQGLAAQLCHKYEVYILDWVGFGDSDAPAIAYTPAVFESCLRDFVKRMFNDPVVVVAAGHAASYVMQLAHRKPAPWSWAVLVSPTWRGPLPTAMGEHRRVYRGLQMLINMPILGQFLYGLNTTKSFLKLMLKRHVFAHPSMVSRDLVRQKQRITRKRRSRLASSAFVTGGLDVIKTSEAWLHWFQPLPLPAMMVIGDQTPPKSRQEMEVVAHFSAVQVHRMSGSLGLHEEYPEALAQVMLPFLEKYLSSKRG